MTTVDFIREVIATDYQFDSLSPDYLGFLNMSPDDDVDAASHVTNIIDNADAFEYIFQELGMTISSANSEELIISLQEGTTFKGTSTK